MTPADFRDRILLPGAAWCAANGGPASNDAALRILMAIAGQESAWTHRYQVSAGMEAGPARSWWQQERGGGITGVLTHRSSAAMAKALCAAADVRPEPAAVWRAVEGHDLLAYGMARLLLWTDPGAVPTTEEAAWICYVDRLWRPGAAKTPVGRALLREKWSSNWGLAGEALVSGR